MAPVRSHRPWHTATPRLRAEIVRTLEEEQPGLRFFIEGQTAKVRGSFAVKDGDLTLDRFAVEIVFPDDYPKSLPTLSEIGRRIPHTEERHVNSRDGSACILVPEEWLVRAPDESFSSYLDGPVRNYFLSQMLVEQGKPWPYGERSHGKAGVVESFGEILGTDDPQLMKRHLAYLVTDRIKGHWLCTCQSGKRLRDCHLERMRELQRRVRPTAAVQMIKRLNDYGL